MLLVSSVWQSGLVVPKYIPLKIRFHWRLLQDTEYSFLWLWVCLGNRFIFIIFLDSIYE